MASEQRMAMLKRNESDRLERLGWTDNSRTTRGSELPCK